MFNSLRSFKKTDKQSPKYYFCSFFSKYVENCHFLSGCFFDILILHFISLCITLIIYNSYGLLRQYNG